MIESIRVADIDPHPLNPRRDVGDVSELAESIRQQGLVQPIVVAPAPEPKPGNFVIIAGNRRFEAVRELGWDTVDCVVRRDLLEPDVVLSAALVENIQRSDLKTSEEGDALFKLHELGVSEASIAKRVGRSRSWVKPRMVVAVMPDRIRTAVDDDQLSLQDAVAYLGLSPKAKERINDVDQAGLRSRVAHELSLKRRQDAVDRLTASLEGEGFRSHNPADEGWTVAQGAVGADKAPAGGRFRVEDNGWGEPRVYWYVQDPGAEGQAGEGEAGEAGEVNESTEGAAGDRAEGSESGDVAADSEWADTSTGLGRAHRLSELVDAELARIDVTADQAHAMLVAYIADSIEEWNREAWSYAVSGSKDLSRTEIVKVVENASLPMLVAAWWRRSTNQYRGLYSGGGHFRLDRADELIALHGWQPTGEVLADYLAAGGKHADA